MKLSISKYKSELVLLSVLFMTPITGATIDIYTPAMPAVAQFFGVNNSIIQISISIYILGYGLSQIFTGLLSDAIGRRPVVILTLSFYVFTTLLCTVVNNIYLFLGLRFLQGVFVSGPGVLNKALVVDIAPRHKISSYMNYVTIFWTLGLILSPLLGSYLLTFFNNWKVIFYFLAIYGFIILFLFFILPETIIQRQKLTISNIYSNICTLFGEKRYFSAGVCIGILYSFLVLFGLYFPFIVIEQLSFSPVVYGKITFLVGISWLVGNTLARFIKVTEISDFLNKLCFVSIFIVCLVEFILLREMKSINLVELVFPLSFIIVLASFVFPKLYGFCVSLFPKIPGFSGAVMGSLFILVTTVISYVATRINITPQNLYLFYTLLSAIALYMYYRFVKSIKI